MEEKMSKVYLIGLKKDFIEVLECVHDFGRLHFVDANNQADKDHAEGVEKMRLEDRSQACLEKLQSLEKRGRTLAENLYGVKTLTIHHCFDTTLRALSLEAVTDRLTAYIDEIEPEAERLVNAVRDLEDEQARYTQYEPLLTQIEPVVNELSENQICYSTALLLEKRFTAAAHDLAEVIDKQTDGEARCVVKTAGENMVALIVIAPTAYGAQLRELIAERNVDRVALPGDFGELPFHQALKALRETIAELPGKIETAREELAFYAEKQRDTLCASMREICDRIAELEMLSKFVETRYTFIMEGYLPARDLDKLQKLLAKRCPDTALESVEIPPSEYDKVPVILTNKKVFKPFQAALGIWGRPVYGTIDPSWLLAISFPFIFGMIVGDAGYGLVLLALCLFFKYRFRDNKAVQAFTDVLAPAGLMAIVFGIFYFEFFGDLAHVYIPGLNQIHPVQILPGITFPFIRTETALQTTFLFMAVGVGVLEVVIGLIIGIINAKRTGEKKHLITKAGILVILFSALAIAAINFLPALTTGMGATTAAIVNYAVYFVLAIGFVFTLFGGGIMGAIDTVESVAHIASYIRIMAVGLVGALLADAANKLAFVTMPNAGGVILALVLHVLNFAIICFSPSIHALRLSFLEFFSKFWKAGKVSYRPFARAGKDD